MAFITRILRFLLKPRYRMLSIFRSKWEQGLGFGWICLLLCWACSLPHSILPLSSLLSSTEQKIGWLPELYIFQSRYLKRDRFDSLQPKSNMFLRRTHWSDSNLPWSTIAGVSPGCNMASSSATKWMGTREAILDPGVLSEQTVSELPVGFQWDYTYNVQMFKTAQWIVSII